MKPPSTPLWNIINPGCTRYMLQVLGPREPGKHNFITSNNSQERLSACELAKVRGKATHQHLRIVLRC